MKNYSKIVSTLATIIAVCSLIIGGVALSHANKVTSPRIEDHTIQIQDLAENLPVSIKMADGSSIQGTLSGDATGYSVKGTSIPNGYIKVQAKNNQLVFDPHTISVTSKMLENGSVGTDALENGSVNSAKIADGSIQTTDIAFNALGSINGIASQGGNIDLVGSEFISVTPDYRNKKIILAVNTDGLKNADLLDGLDSTYFTNAGNINAGVLSVDRFSAMADLQSEGALDFNAGSDLVTREQALANFLTDSTFSAYEDLISEDRLDFTDNTDLVTKAQAYDHFLSNEGGVINGNLVINGSALIDAVQSNYAFTSVLETYTANIDAGFFANLSAGTGFVFDLDTTLLSADEVTIAGNLDVMSINGNTMDFYQNADNISAGTLDNKRFSAYSNLEFNEYLDFTDNVDLVTKQQLSDNFLSINGGMVAGDISALKIFTSANGDIDAVLEALLNDTNDIKTSLLGLIARVNGLEDRIVILEGYDLNDRLALLEALNLSTLDGRITTLTSEVNQLKATDNTTNIIIFKLTGRVTELEKMVEELRTDNTWR